MFFTGPYAYFSTFAAVDPTQANPQKNRKILTQTDPTKPMGQPNPWTTLLSLLLTLAWWTAGLGPDLQNILRRTQEFS